MNTIKLFVAVLLLLIIYNNIITNIGVNGKANLINKIYSNNPIDNDEFGYSVSIYKNTAVVGSGTWWACDEGSGTGCIYIFHNI